MDNFLPNDIVLADIKKDLKKPPFRQDWNQVEADIRMQMLMHKGYYGLKDAKQTPRGAVQEIADIMFSLDKMQTVINQEVSPQRQKCQGYTEVCY